MDDATIPPFKGPQSGGHAGSLAALVEYLQLAPVVGRVFCPVRQHHLPPGTERVKLSLNLPFYFSIRPGAGPEHVSHTH